MSGSGKNRLLDETYFLILMDIRNCTMIDDRRENSSLETSADHGLFSYKNQLCRSV